MATPSTDQIRDAIAKDLYWDLIKIRRFGVPGEGAFRRFDRSRIGVRNLDQAVILAGNLGHHRKLVHATLA